MSGARARRPEFDRALDALHAGEPASQVARDLGMSRATLYRRIAALG